MLTLIPIIPFLGFNLRGRTQNMRGRALYTKAFIMELLRTIKNKKQPKCARI